MKYIAILLTISLLFRHTCSAQSDSTKEQFVVGSACPDFHLRDLQYYPLKEAGLTDFKGKWLVLDFWTKSCVSCVASFPKVNLLQKKFTQDVQFILVGRNDKKHGAGIEKLYERFKNHYDLDLTVAYDSVLFQRFGIFATPYIVVIDPAGIVRKTTWFLNESLLGEIMSSNALQPSSDKKNRFIESDSTILSRSEISQWIPGEGQRIPPRIDSQLKKGTFTGKGLSLRNLYNYAYFGLDDWPMNDSLVRTVSRFPVLLTSDSSKFIPDYTSGMSLYNCKLKIPIGTATRRQFQEVLQTELFRCFGFKASVETRSVPCLELRTIGNAGKNLMTKGGIPDTNGGHAGMTFTNLPVTALLTFISSYHQTQPAIFDATGIQGNIDITIDAIIPNLEDLKRALLESGLHLVPVNKEMKTLVIRDPIASIE